MTVWVGPEGVLLSEVSAAGVHSREEGKLVRLMEAGNRAEVAGGWGRLGGVVKGTGRGRFHSARWVRPRTRCVPGSRGSECCIVRLDTLWEDASHVECFNHNEIKKERIARV